MVIEVIGNVFGKVMARTLKLRKRELKLSGNLRLKVKGIGSIQ